MKLELSAATPHYEEPSQGKTDIRNALIKELTLLRASVG
jgi:hypothetical protein